MMEKPKIWFVVGMLVVAAIGVLYLNTLQTKLPPSTNVNEQLHYSELRDRKGFHWFKHWNELDLGIVKKFYQRYTVNEMQILWNEKLFYKYSNYESIQNADTLYPWDIYLEYLRKLGHPFLDFTDYENALETRMTILIPTRTYWYAMSPTERETYLYVRGLPPDTDWETYQEHLIKQIVVYRINWWCSGGMSPFSNHGNKKEIK